MLRFIQRALAWPERVRCALAARSGQGLVEYALIIALVAIAVIAMLTLLGNRVQGIFSYIGSQLTAP